MNLVIAASPEVAFPTIDSLLNSHHKILHIISQPDRPAGRGKLLTPTPVGSKYNCEKPLNEDQFSNLLNGSDLLIKMNSILEHITINQNQTNQKRKKKNEKNAFILFIDGWA